MTFYELSIIATVSATLAVTCVYFFLYSLYRQSYIGLWAVFWLVHFIIQIFYRTPFHQMSIPMFVTVLFTVNANYVLLLYATSKFLNRTINKGWYYWAGAITIFTDIAFYLKAHFLVQLIPSCIFVACVDFWHGYMFTRKLPNKSWGKNIVGFAFAGLGIHTLDMPFLLPVTWFAPWGFLISGLLRFVISIGTLILYLEKSFHDLSIKEAQYRLLAENAVDVIYLYRLQPKQGFEYISPSIERLSGYPASHYYHSPDMFFSLIHPGDTFLLESLLRNPAAHAKHPLIMRFIRRNHALIWVEQTTVPIFDERGVCTSFEGIIRDITARKKLEQDVSRLDRLNTVGQMAANVAHEIRNPLTTVQGYLQLFLKKSIFAPYTEQLHLLISELERSNLIIKEYLSLCQNKARELKPCPLNKIIEDLQPLITADANASNKDIHYYLAPTPDIHLDEKEMRQLILNLVRNALEAMDSGGVVTIQTQVNEQGELVLIVQDQGKGIPPHVLENIGKPFLTTKENGTGIGLAVVYRIADDHQANIQIETGPTGTTFRIIFKVS
ncbi:PAS domain S-box-containing protein [Propionispora hippei DSM 15287]|uniref:histidine kinase n=2 Tax=Propionispora TaxID=112902 RepID=A0A1M6HEC8_9FIRM|nr:PAS domain S-box-containing protein [Propionispora hippei DSM 15287]